jgi:hypothetical protein
MHAVQSDTTQENKCVQSTAASAVCVRCSFIVFASTSCPPCVDECMLDNKVVHDYLSGLVFEPGIGRLHAALSVV